jgi:hypothetical protein
MHCLDCALRFAGMHPWPVSERDGQELLRELPGRPSRRHRHFQLVGSASCVALVEQTLQLFCWFPLLQLHVPARNRLCGPCLAHLRRKLIEPFQTFDRAAPGSCPAGSYPCRGASVPVSRTDVDPACVGLHLQLCSAGRYQDQPGKSACVDCEAGERADGVTAPWSVDVHCLCSRAL